MSTPTITAAPLTGEPVGAAVLTPHQAVTALVSMEEFALAADTWRAHLVALASPQHGIPTLAVATAPYAWDTAVSAAGVEAAVSDLVDAFGDAR